MSKLTFVNNNKTSETEWCEKKTVIGKKETIPEKAFAILVDKIIMYCLTEKVDYRYVSEGEDNSRDSSVWGYIMTKTHEMLYLYDKHKEFIIAYLSRENKEDMEDELSLIHI